MRGGAIRMKQSIRESSTLRFVIPVICENLLSNIVGLIFSHLIGGISASSLTTISQCNNVINVISAMATMLVTGTSILCSRLLGADERLEASHVVEQAVFLSAAAALTITALCLIFSTPLMDLLMPNAEAAVLAEGIAFFRVLIVSLLFLMLYNVFTSTLRASGDSRSPLIIAVLMCGMQLLFAWLFLRVMNLDIIGAGLVYLFARIVGFAAAFFILLRSNDYMLSIRRMLKPNGMVFKRILKIGIPTSIESIFVQFGYLIAGSMVIGLGTFEAAVYNVANTLYSFAALPQSICATIATPIVGHLIGAHDFKKARRSGWCIGIMGMVATIMLCTLLVTFGSRLTPIYSSDVQIQQKAAKALWVVFVTCIPAISLNTFDPQLRVGGDVKYVMYVTVIAVWLIRLPLTYLLCYVWNMGAEGVFWANTLSLSFRMAFNLTRFIKGKYLYMRV